LFWGLSIEPCHSGEHDGAYETGGVFPATHDVLLESSSEIQEKFEGKNEINQQLFDALAPGTEGPTRMGSSSSAAKAAGA